MKTCFLHIGSEKTGTTSIQKCLKTNRDELLNHGFWYPRSASYKTEVVHRRLTDVALNGPIEEGGQFASQFEHEYRDAVEAEAHTAIISSEFFHSTFRDSAAIERIRLFLAPLFDRICVIYYARRQDSLAVSMHSTAVRGGHTTNRSALPIYDSKGHHYFDHLAVCDLWSGQFGPENLICRIYERGKLLNGDVVDDIAAIIGLQNTYGPRQFSANESLSTECMDVLRLLNRSPYAANDVLRRELIAIGRERGGPKVPMLTRSEAQQFVAHFQESNAKFFQKYVDPSLATDFEGGFDYYPTTLPEPTSEEIVSYLFGPTPPHAARLDNAPAMEMESQGFSKQGSARHRRRERRRGHPPGRIT